MCHCHAVPHTEMVPPAAWCRCAGSGRLPWLQGAASDFKATSCCEHAPGNVEECQVEAYISRHIAAKSGRCEIAARMVQAQWGILDISSFALLAGQTRSARDGSHQGSSPLEGAHFKGEQGANSTEASFA